MKPLNLLVHLLGFWRFGGLFLKKRKRSTFYMHGNQYCEPACSLGYIRTLQSWRELSWDFLQRVVVCCQLFQWQWCPVTIRLPSGHSHIQVAAHMQSPGKWQSVLLVNESLWSVDHVLAMEYVYVWHWRAWELVTSTSGAIQYGVPIPVPLLPIELSTTAEIPGCMMYMGMSAQCFASRLSSSERNRR